MILLSIAGLGIVFYPNISNLWNEYRERSLMSDYSSAVGGITQEEKNAMTEAAAVYNESLIGTQVPDAFLDHEHTPDTYYESLLNPDGTGVMGEVEIPCIRISVPIYHYTDDESLEKGAGHLPGSSLPIGGESTHSVISAHRGLPSKKLFTDLDRVKEGNQFYLHVLGETLAYEVDQILVVEPQDTESLSVVEGEDYCTLLTCTPYAVNTHRLLVRGHRIPYDENAYSREGSRKAAPSAVSVRNRVLCVAAGLLIAAVLTLLIRVINEKRKKNRETP